jgi:hypothetical protein
MASLFRRVILQFELGSYSSQRSETEVTISDAAFCRSITGAVAW